MRFTLRTAAVAALTAAVLVLPPAALDVPGGTAAAADPDALPADLALVPADAVGFVHVRLADIWNNDLMAGFRKTWEKAGAKALADLDKQFVPAPSSLARATAFVLFDDQKRPQAVGVLAFSRAFDQTAVLNSYLPDAAAAKVGPKSVYRSPGTGFAVYFPDDKHIVIGADGALDAYLAKAPAKTGPLAAAIKLAAGGTKAVVASADVSALPIPPAALKDVPPEARPILKAKQLTVAVDLGADARLDVRAVYADAAAAGDAEKAVKALAEMGRTELAKARKEMEAKLDNPNVKTPRPAADLPEALATVFALGGLNRLDDTLADPKLIARDKAELALSVSVPKELFAVSGFATVGVGLLLPAVQKTREAAARMSSQNNLKQIGIGIHAFNEANKRWPMDIVDKNGKPLLSWRVAILPYIEQNNLYQQFKLDEPWDSPNNKKWSQVMVKTFMSPSAVPPEKAEWGMTNYLGIAGPGGSFETGKKITVGDFTDGLSKTVMVIETNEWVPWAKPGDFPFDPKKPLPKIVPPGNLLVFNVLMGDGSVRAIDAKTSEKTLKAAFTRNGGERVDIEKDK